ncbi:ABC transporter substrate-binding protein [Rhabdothermincola sp.]|uniref:ABC transporter substrate-binding protein n=1 Tax=Rhabdothermincola sp. TaxID=2820405 RepID=UPI002FE3FEA3
MSPRAVEARRRNGRRLLAAVVALALAASAVACSGAEESQPAPTTEAGFRPGGTLRLGVAGPTALDPALAVPTEQAEMIAIDLLYDSLATDANPAEPDLAESFQPSEDHRRWRIVLRNRVFADGSPITAEDVKFTLERLARLGSASLAGTRLDIVAGYEALAVERTASELSGVRVLDQRTLEIDLAVSYTQLPELLGSPLYGIVPRAAVQAAGDRFGEQPVGSGPYRFVGRDGSVVRLERAPGPAGEAAGPDAVELVGFDTVGDSYAAFEDGRVDWSLVPAERETLAEAAARYGTGAFRSFGAELWFGINQHDPAYADVRFRQAIVAAIDREGIARQVFPGRLPLRGLVAAGVPGAADDACTTACAYDPDRARALLAEVFGGGPVTTTVVLDTYDDPSQIELIEAVTADLQAVGIPVEHRVKPFEEYRSFVVSGEADVFSFGWVGINPTQEAYLGPPFLSGSRDNVVGVSSEAVDAAIIRARATPDAAAREALYREAEQRLLGDGVAIPVVQLVTNQVVAPRVNGFAGRLDGTFDVTSLWLAD